MSVTLDRFMNCGMAGIHFDVATPQMPDKNPISFLQEISQMHKYPLPEYKPAPGNYNEFGHEVKINFSRDPEKVLNFYGHGKTKKVAKTQSAECALEYLRKNRPEAFNPPPPPEVVVDMNELSPMVRDMHLKKMPQLAANKQTFPALSGDQLAAETEQVSHERVGLELGQLIQKARMEKGLTQKDLAAKINEKPDVVVEFESGRAIFNIHIVSKLERALGVKIHRPSVMQTFGGRI